MRTPIYSAAVAAFVLGLIGALAFARSYPSLAPPERQNVGALLHDRIIGALELCCRRGEMLMIQNKRANWDSCQIGIPGATAIVVISPLSSRLLLLPMCYPAAGRLDFTPRNRQFY